MRICVVGCGAVGSLFAANLATLDDVEVWVFDLNKAHVDAIKKNGLQLTGAGQVVGRPNATSDAGELPACDFGIVATKAMHADGAIAATAHAFANGSVASVMNGVGNEETLATHVERVIRGTTFPAGKLLEPGVVQWDVKGDTTLGPFEPRPIDVAAIAPLADACTRAGLPTSAVGDARPGQWRKVIFNAATNPMARSRASPTAASASGPISARSSRGSSPKERPSPRHRGSCSTPIRRSSSTTPPVPTWRTGTRPRCCRTSRPGGRRRSTI